MFNEPTCHIGWVSPIYKQCKKVFEDLENATRDSGLLTYNKSDLEVRIGKTKLSFFSGERPDNIRGNTFDYLIIDEAAFQKESLWVEVLQPATLVKGKKVIFISTPNGKNHFYSLSKMHIYDKSWIYHVNESAKNPFITKSDLENIRLQVPLHIFEQEYLAKFIDNTSSVFADFKACVRGFTDKNLKKYGGLDVGRADDYTVLTVLDKEKNQVYSKRWRQMEWSKIAKEVAAEINRFKAETFVEVNNQGDVVFEMLQGFCPNLVHPFVTTSKSKPILIESLILAFEQKELSLQNIEYQNSELEAFTYVYDNKSRQVKYGAPSGMHDDSVISLALALESIKQNKQRGSYHLSPVRFK
jgi:phage FluMu gp28-like protein